MSMAHHGDAEQIEAQRRFMQQLNGTARREYPKGRMGHEDDGALSFAMTADRLHNTVIIRFGKPVEWIGLGPDDVQALIDKLSEKLVELQAGVSV